MSHNQVLTTAQMRAAEQALFDAGTSVYELMEIAADSAAEWVRRIAAGRAITVLCGPGNNGGDGYVIARKLQEAGNAVQVIAPLPPKTKAAIKVRDNWQGQIDSSGGPHSGEVLVDCLFGCGLSRPLSAEHALLLRDLAERHATTIAIDVPSGVASDTGAHLNDKLPDCDVTLALGAWKYAHWSLPGRSNMGERRLVPIGIGPAEVAAQLVSKPLLRAPAVDTHKYRRGLAVIVAGAMPGASQLAAASAMRGGAGYVKLIADGPEASSNPALVIETGPLEDALSDKRINALLIGPGLGRDSHAEDKLAQALNSRRPIVLDADALVALKPSQLPEDLPVIATPHDGELDILCRNFGVLAETRRDKARALAKISKMIVLAKGPDSIIAAPDGRLGIVPPASSWLSVAGSGDVLAGIVLSRLSAGADPFDAACEAVWLHAEAARCCGAAFTPMELAHRVSSAVEACL